MNFNIITEAKKITKSTNKKEYTGENGTACFAK